MVTIIDGRKATWSGNRGVISASDIGWVPGRFDDTLIVKGKKETVTFIKQRIIASAEDLHSGIVCYASLKDDRVGAFELHVLND